MTLQRYELLACPLRIQHPGAVCHVMNRPGSRQKVFLDKRHYEAFLKTLSEVRDSVCRLSAGHIKESPRGWRLTQRFPVVSVETGGFASKRFAPLCKSQMLRF